MVKIIPRDQIKHLEWNQETRPISVPSTPENIVPNTPKSKILHSIGDLTIESLVNTGKPFYNADIPTAMITAQDYAGIGVVATMPYLIAGKANSYTLNGDGTKVRDNNHYLWKDWFTAYTEEDIGVDTNGVYASKGESVVITLHGGGILTAPVITKAYEEGLTEHSAAKLLQKDIDSILQNGTLPSGEDITIYQIDDLKKGIADPFGRYAVVMAFDDVKSLESKQYKKKEFLANPLVLARAGTMEYLEKYYDLAHNKDGVGCWNRFSEINPTIPQGRLLFLGGGYDGLVGNGCLSFSGRFVGVAPEAHGTKK